MNKSITQDMKYRQSLMKYAEKYGVSRAMRSLFALCALRFVSRAYTFARCALCPALRPPRPVSHAAPRRDRASLVENILFSKSEQKR